MNIGIDYDLFLREYQRLPNKQCTFSQCSNLLDHPAFVEDKFFLISDQKKEWELQKSFRSPLCLSYPSYLPVIETCNFVDDKVTECLKANLDVMLTDDVFLAFRVQEEQIPVILLNRPWNESFYELGDNIYRVFSWAEVAEILLEISAAIAAATERK
ncbi:MAG: hypothetical protein BWY48_00397 [Parcubacteria group bacterium ADurb.Bin305]|nr:hypothetical protein [Candidatus Paceibacterota bacterium]OQA43817.1 MAG: hypothetical protein BWY48_00397 [Parcubacteria group bacterium ADurb.Bin305]